MTLPEKFKAYVLKHNLFTSKDNLLLAVSGGVDSVVLCELCSQLGFNFEIAHCNFQLRGEESQRDEDLVKTLAGKYSVSVSIKKFETEKYAEENKLSIQVAARNLRYSWFEELINKTANNLEQKIIINQGSGNGKRENVSIRPLEVRGNHFLLTAHHANDNVETLLMNFFKGTGIAGLKGIEPKKGKIIRPLLFAKKQELQKFATDYSLYYQEDSSNASDKYTRNYFRNQLIPSLQKVFPETEENLINSIDKFKDIEALYNQSVTLHKKKLMEEKGNEIHIPILKLLKAKPLPTILFEIIKEFNFTPHQTEEVIKILNSDSGKYISSQTHKIIKNRSWLIITPHDTLTASNILINENEAEVEFPQGNLKIKKAINDHGRIPNGNDLALLDEDKINFPLLLRKWKQGDYFYPLGMKKKSGALGKKKLSKFFIDQKMSLIEKEKIWVIESNKKIMWVINKRIDDRFKVTERTTNLIKIQFTER